MKKYLFAGSITLVLIFLWWFVGGNIAGIYTRPSPAEKSFAFLWQNFNLGLATVFEVITNFLK
jgi:hypothetical protein